MPLFPPIRAHQRKLAAANEWVFHKSFVSTGLCGIVCTKTDNKNVCTQRKDPQQEGDHLQADDRGLRGNQTYGHLDFCVLASRIVRKYSWCVSHPICSILLGPP